MIIINNKIIIINNEIIILKNNLLIHCLIIKIYNNNKNNKIKNLKYIQCNNLKRNIK
jgi:hypothetical protein